MEHPVDNTWSELSSDLVQLIFYRLPEPSVLRAASVCKRWYSVTQTPSFAEFYRKNQSVHDVRNTFVYRFNGLTYAFTEHLDSNGGFEFQAVEKGYRVPTIHCLQDGDVPTIEAAGGVHLAFTGPKETTLRYKLSLVEKNWRTTADMPYVVQDPVVAVLEGISGGGGHKLVVAGGLCTCISDDEDLFVSIYDDQTASWDRCAPLPSELRDWRFSLSMAAVVHKGRLFVYDIYTGLVSWLDLDSKHWSPVVQLRPSAKVHQLFLVSRAGVLRLVVVQEASEREISFTVWNVVNEFENTMRVGEIVHTSVTVNTSAGALLSIPRWASSAMEVSLGMIAVLMFCLLKLQISCFTATKRALCSLQARINFTANVIRKAIFNESRLGQARNVFYDQIRKRIVGRA